LLWVSAIVSVLLINALLLHRALKNFISRLTAALTVVKILVDPIGSGDLQLEFEMLS